MEPQCLRRISLVALALAWVGVAWAWAEPPKSGGTLRMAFEADITGLDPAIPGLQNYYVNQNLFGSCVATVLDMVSWAHDRLSTFHRIMWWSVSPLGESHPR
jgi:hypothetical protein